MPSAHMEFRWILERVKFTDKIELSPSEDVYTIGRGKENAIKCLSLYVSRRHCKILQRGGNLAIVDLSSANGTYINQTRILSEREIPLQEGDLIGMGVSETTDSGCYVFRLYRQVLQKIAPHVSPFPYSNKNENEVVIIVDSDSENSVQESRKAQAKETKKRPTKKERVICSKVRRLENTTMNWESSSDLSVRCSTVFSHSAERLRKSLCEDTVDKINIEKPTHEQNLRLPDDTSVKTTAVGSEVSDRISKCENVYETERSMNTLIRCGTVSDKAYESELGDDNLFPDAMNSKNVPVIRIGKNELKSKVEPVSLPSEVTNRTERSSARRASVHSMPTSSVTAMRIKGRSDSEPACSNRRYSSEPTSTALTNFKTITSSPTLEAESQMLNHSGTDSLMMNTTVVSVPVGMTELKSEKTETDVQHSVKSAVGECFGVNSTTNENKCSSVTKQELPFLDNSLQQIPAVATCGMDKKRSEHNREPSSDKEPHNKELSVKGTKNVSKDGNETQSPTGNKSLCFGLNEESECLGTDNAVHTHDNITADSGSASTSITLESHLTNEGAVSEGSGKCSAASDNLLHEMNVEMKKDGYPSPLCRKNKSKVGTTKSKKIPVVKKCVIDETSVRGKRPRRNFKFQKVSLSEQDVLSCNQEVETESCSYTKFQEENKMYLKKPVKKKQKVTEKSHGRSCKSRPSSLSSKQSNSFVATRDSKVGTSNRPHLLKGNPTLSINSINSHDFDDDLISMRLREVLYSDHSGTRTAVPHVTYDADPTVKSKRSTSNVKQCVVKIEPLQERTLLSDVQMVAKQKRKLKKQRTSSVLSSCSSEDELQRKRRKLESAGQTSGKSNSCLNLLKGRRRLSFTSESSDDSNRKSVKKSSTESVDEVKKNSNNSDTSVQNSVDSVAEYKGRNIAQDNKNRVAGSGSVEEVTINEEIVSIVCKNKVIVKLERLNENVLKSNGLVVSESENESLNYTLDEDIIVISDDDDEYFPSSQIFDDQKVPLELLKTEGQVPTLEDPPFNKAPEDDDSILVFEDDSDLDDDQWFSRLSQQDPESEPVKVLPPQQLQAEIERKISDSREESLKIVSVPQAITAKEGIEKEILADDFLKTDDEVKSKRERKGSDSREESLKIMSVSQAVTAKEGIEKEVLADDLLKMDDDVKSKTERKVSDSREESLKVVSVPQAVTAKEGIEKEMLADDFLKTDDEVKSKRERKGSDSGEESLKIVSVPQAVTDNGTEKELLADDLLNMDDEVKSKQEEPINRCKYNSKTLIIDAPPMPPRRAFQRGISAEVAVRIYKEQTKVCQQPVKPTNLHTMCKKGHTSEKKIGYVPTNLHTIWKKGHASEKKEVYVHPSLSDDVSILTAKQKKQIADKRKEKLRAISEKEKAVAAASRKQSMKTPAKVKIKVTNKNRGAFLTEGAETTYNAAEMSDTYQTSLICSAVKNLHLGVQRTSSVNVPKQDSIKSGATQPKKCESRSASAPVRNIKDLPRIPRISERPSASERGGLEVPSSGVEMESVLVDVPMAPPFTSALSTLPIMKTSVPTSRYKKKTVHFKKDSELVAIHFIPVAEDSRLLPVAHKKDAPTPRKVFDNQFQQKGPDLEEVLYAILCWNPKWLEEQKKRAVTEPPPVHGDKLWPMLSSFVSYKDYLKVLTPLLLLELWTSITNESESNLSDPRKAPVVVGIDQVDATPHCTHSKKELMHITCHALLSDYESQKQFHPRIGDLVYLELELENERPQNHHSIQPAPDTKHRRVVPIFAYVKYSNKDAITGRTSVHKEILKHTARPSTKLTLVLLAKFRPYDVKMSHAMRIKVVSYIKSDLRLFQAMAHLPSSPLCSHILRPEEQNFSLPDLFDLQIVPLIKQDQLNEPQKRAVLQTAHVCLKSEPKICMIQGPPGTGKSHVIVNLIIQILYGQKQYRKHGSRKNVPRILVCAPSNAAIDELVIRLLRIRQTIQKEDRFKMVRTGQQETMNPIVKDISVVELAKRDARNTAQSLECMESLDLEIRNLEARKNSLIMALETARQKNLTDSISETEFKLGETEKKLFHMKRSKTQNTSLDPRELWRMERDAQSRILLGADIVATTLSSCFNNQMENVFTMHKNGKERSGFQFTCCIVDEATQSQELETLIPLMLGVTTLVLVGDAKQLPATVLSKVAKENGLGKSLFARLQTCFEDTVKNPVQFLGIQYRMHPDICLWPSRFFYNGRLRSAPTLAQQRVCPLVPYCILSLEYKQSDSGELSNAGEAEVVSHLTLGLLEKLGNQHLSIGIITPYHKQRTMIMSILHASSSGSQHLEVNTIDSFQGQERDIIVMSCVRTGGVGFLAETQRLNVALTRARYSLLLCGNFMSLQNDNMWRALLENASQRNVLKYVPSSVAKNKDELLKLVLRDN